MGVFAQLWKSRDEHNCEENGGIDLPSPSFCESSLGTSASLFSYRYVSRPLFHTQLSEPNWPSSFPSPLTPNNVYNSSASSSGVHSSTDHQTIYSGTFAPEHFRQEPFSLFFDVTSPSNPFCCDGILPMFSSDYVFSSVNSSPLNPFQPFILSPEACALLTNLFQRKNVTPELRHQLIAEMLSLQNVRFDKNRRSSLAPSHQTDFFAGSSPSAALPPHLSPHSSDSLFFCIAPPTIVSRKNSFAFAAQPLGITSAKQRRRRAVITVDAESTQILIASDSVCRLFGLRDRSLIGKSLDAVFPVALSSHQTASERVKGPLLLQNVLFVDDGRNKRHLRPVYGRPMDVLDAEGRLQTLSVWSYPLAGPSTNVEMPRKNSAVLMRSPSGFLTSDNTPTATAQSSEPSATKVFSTALLALNNQRNLAQGEFLSSHLFLTASHQRNAQLQPSTSAHIATNCCASAVAYSPQLKEVLEEEHQQQQGEKSDTFRCSLSTKERLVAKAAKFANSRGKKLQQQQQQQETERGDQQGIHLDSSAFPLNEHFLSVDSTSAQSTAPNQRPAERGGGGNIGQPQWKGRQGAETTTEIMVQAGVQKRSADCVAEDAVVVVPIGHPSGDEPQQKGFLRPECADNIPSVGKEAPNDKNDSTIVVNGRTPTGRDQQNNRWLILMEPISALYASIILGAKGRIFRVDDSFAAVLGYDYTNRLLGVEIQRLIPSLNVGKEWEAKEQSCCGYSVKHNGVPFSVTVRSERDQDSDSVYSYEVRIRSLASINGVVTLTASGSMYSYNENFFSELLGIRFDDNTTEEGLVSANTGLKDITDVIPKFFEYLEVAHFHIDRHKSQKQQQNDLQNGSSVDTPAFFLPTVSHSSSCLFTQELTAARRALGRRTNTFYGQIQQMNWEGGATEEERNSDDPSNGGGIGRPEIIPGIFYGLAKHADGMMIPVKVEVTSVDSYQQNSGQQQQLPRLFAVCIGFDRSTDYGISQLSEEDEQQQEEEKKQQPLPSVVSNGAIAATTSPGLAQHQPSDKDANVVSPEQRALTRERAARFSIGGACLRECVSESVTDLASCGKAQSADDRIMQHGVELKLQGVSLDALEDENNDAVRGEYSKCYDTFQLIGNGAFGSVKLAAHKDTGLLAVSNPKRANKMVPIEVHLLENLDHPNILVMEKCGCGMDLFEFIDHQPKLDEALISYIFRQIVSAVDYLHDKHIVHRDLKDENVIIDQNFGCKLIDFGSAAFFGEGIVFSFFCGTMEYCSPEVLNGNKYLGPEVEMWSLGILLYTLVFFENPFRSSHEIVHAEIALPRDISEGLYQVLSLLLQPDPRSRASVGEIKRHKWLTQRVDPRVYNFKEVLKNCEHVQVAPPLYMADLQNHLKQTGSTSCSNLASISITSAMNAEPATSGKQTDDGVVQVQQQQQQQMGVVSSVG
uniref:Protein kinase domain-containing protein n=1 Tax=Globodera rostochiensis TaxID=31243 RepID=A0A914HV33_GLORO